MLTKPVQAAINRQINSERMASYSYLAMSAWCVRQNFTGAARWLRLQSQEEYAHAMRLFDFVLARGGQVTLAELKTPRGSYKTLPEVFETAYKQELEVSKQIDALYELAGEQKAYAAWSSSRFITEQVEEEKTMREIVARMNMVKDDPASLLDIDRELGSRVPEAAGGAEAGA